MSSFNQGKSALPSGPEKVVATLCRKRGIVQTAYTLLAAEQRCDLLKIVRSYACRSPKVTSLNRAGQLCDARSRVEVESVPSDKLNGIDRLMSPACIHLNNRNDPEHSYSH
jgi:hypothetical protein